MMIKNFTELLEAAKSQKKMKIVVAAAHDEDVIKGVNQAKEMGIAEPVLVGDKAKIISIMDGLRISWKANCSAMRKEHLPEQKKADMPDFSSKPTKEPYSWMK
jgi:phosphotransacetylase